MNAGELILWFLAGLVALLLLALVAGLVIVIIKAALQSQPKSQQRLKPGPDTRPIISRKVDKS